jgi:hypothetical protein
MDVTRAGIPIDSCLAEVDANFAVFEQELPALLRSHPGKYALYRHRELIEIFDTWADACRAGRRLYPDDIFSVQEITDRKIDLGWFSLCPAQS